MQIKLVVVVVVVVLTCTGALVYQFLVFLNVFKKCAQSYLKRMCALAWLISYYTLDL